MERCQELIDAFLGRMLERPRMYASSPESLDESLFTLESLRGQICAEMNQQDGVISYTNFLIREGFNAMSLCQKYREITQESDQTEEGSYSFVVSVWSRYLRENGRQS